MRVVVSALSVFLLSSILMGQAASNPTSTPTGAGAAQPKLPEGMDSTLEKYVSASERRSMADLQAVWPELEKNKKEYGKIKKHFEDGNVSNVHVTLQPLETQKVNDDAIVQAQRTERYVQQEHVDMGGDLDRNRAPAQNAGPHDISKDVKKDAKVWMKLHKQNDQWVIVQVSDKPLSF